MTKKPAVAKEPKAKKAPAVAKPDAANEPVGDTTAENTGEQAVEQVKNQHKINRLDQAQNLPEVEQDVEGTDSPATPVTAAESAIESFKDHDGRTMRVVTVDGELYKQAI